MNKPKTPEKIKDSYSPWRVLSEFIGHVFALVNSGRIFPAFGLVILVLAAIVLIRLPEAQIAPLIEHFFKFLSSSTALALGLLLVSNIAWIMLFRAKKKMYENEIVRLAAIRSELMHIGVEQVVIKTHQTSNGKQTESYIIPDFPNTQQKDKK